jgi:hypothetical protein
LSADDEPVSCQLSPLDWVHWLYLQPPAHAEVRVTSCVYMSGAR